MPARALRRSEHGWRRGLVTAAGADGWLRVSVEGAEDAEDAGGGTGAGATGAAGAHPAQVLAWHHDDVSAALPPDTPVRLHQRLGALLGPRGALSLLIARAPEPVPEPVALETWAAHAAGGALTGPAAERAVVVLHRRRPAPGAAVGPALGPVLGPARGSSPGTAGSGRR